MYFLRMLKKAICQLPGGLSPYAGLENSDKTPAAITISPAPIITIFSNMTVKAMTIAHATSTSPRIIAPNPSKKFMNQSISLLNERYFTFDIYGLICCHIAKRPVTHGPESRHRDFHYDHLITHHNHFQSRS